MFDEHFISQRARGILHNTTIYALEALSICSCFVPTSSQVDGVPYFWCRRSTAHERHWFVDCTFVRTNSAL